MTQSSVLGNRRGFITATIAGLLTIVGRKTGSAQTVVAPKPLQIGRRIVTGVDAQGRSIVESDVPVQGNAAWKSGGNEGFVFWVAREIPAPLSGSMEPTSEYRAVNRAPSHGLDGRLFTWAPGYSYQRHATPTLDFIIILSGKLALVLDTETRTLEPGDVLVQRGTQHSWRVVGSEPCTFVGIMIDAARA